MKNKKIILKIVPIILLNVLVLSLLIYMFSVSFYLFSPMSAILIFFFSGGMIFSASITLIEHLILKEKTRKEMETLIEKGAEKDFELLLLKQEQEVKESLEKINNFIKIMRPYGYITIGEETEEQTEICKKFSEVKDFINKYVQRKNDIDKKHL